MGRKKKEISSSLSFSKESLEEIQRKIYIDHQMFFYQEIETGQVHLLSERDFRNGDFYIPKKERSFFCADLEGDEMVFYLCEGNGPLRKTGSFRIGEEISKNTSVPRRVKQLLMQKKEESSISYKDLLYKEEDFSPYAYTYYECWYGRNLFREKKVRRLHFLLAQKKRPEPRKSLSQRERELLSFPDIEDTHRFLLPKERVKLKRFPYRMQVLDEKSYRFSFIEEETGKLLHKIFVYQEEGTVRASLFIKELDGRWKKINRGPGKFVRGGCQQLIKT